ncbi:GPI ethanolamine phosphate transferase 2 [Heracleum sosnowskyi]|uniref:GPI ethanolamine phosphate transferase 2 n=1 Tax=Heracleum sosnowskyi TaxID=360622 RepID=A0AAD8H604_9APIA|nr:GPI ethanolamine phosphate transferase 2 [Heracleum sosnowskyi]
MAALTCTKITLLTIAAVVIQIIGLSLFVLGFFPVKPAISGISGPESFSSPVCRSAENYNYTNHSPEELKSLYLELSNISPSYDRLILMVVDGLPAEFILGRDDRPAQEFFRKSMPYTQSLLDKGVATGYHTKAAPPTVTMPRLKAMVSGSVGGFLDVALNFNTQELLDDNLIGQFFKIGWKMVMFGDETWLKLFPRSFARHDGVHSFFVKDTVQVDHNVSRHLDDELDKTDWKLLILHYLGLDHVGHTGGRNSVLMGPKLEEMDEVIKKIHRSMIQNQLGRTLLMVVSDHGMTENGNHGGASYEETDALMLLIGLRDYDHRPTTHKTVNQVDITPTMALLFGVPIPINSAGILIAETLKSLEGEQQLRALELNSWQIFRLLQAQLPDLSCSSSCGVDKDGRGSEIGECDSNMEEIFCCLYVKAAALHKSWKSCQVFGSNKVMDYSSAVLAYNNFLRTASEWLSRRATNKPVGVLTFGVTGMLISSLVLLCLLYQLEGDVHVIENRTSHIKSRMHKWHMDEIFAMSIVCFLVLSMGSSSLIEEEQYIWHFMTSTSNLLLLRKAIQSISSGNTQDQVSFIGRESKRRIIQMFSIIFVLISGRILRGWHQGGVNWTNFPDLSKWLENEGTAYIKPVQLVSLLLLITSGFYALAFLRPRKGFVIIVGLSFVFPAFLVLQYIIKYQRSDVPESSYSATLLVQLIYVIIGTSTFGIVVALPWFMPVRNPKGFSSHQNKALFVGIADSLYLIGLVYIICWCLLQLLLQQPINSAPILLLLVQILASMCFSSVTEPKPNQWVELASLYYLGMAGHFALGNTNTIATIDVAGAYMGVSSHSTILSGILMFIITYAAPMLALLSMLMNISLRSRISLVNAQDVDLQYMLKKTLAYPCLVPLGLNSIFLVAYTTILLLMRNHLFVWSVFSPKYMYVCATTACIYLGVIIVASTVFYTYSTLGLRKMWQAKIR